MTRCRTLLAVVALAAAPCSAAAQARGQQADTVVLPLAEIAVSVTRSGRAIRELPASVTVINRARIRLSAAATLPDLLRSIPGLTTADYQSGIAVFPARQSPSMRGLGGTSASRALVLVDGIPMNDPYTGWVAWSRVPLELIERVEVVRGGAAGIWGNRAMGGIINIITANPSTNMAQLGLRTGSAGTGGVNGAVTRVTGPLSISAAGEYYDTDGHYVVAPEIRGTIDAPAGVTHRTGFTRLRYDASPSLTLYAGGDWFDEDRRNATRLRSVGTTVAKINAGARFRRNRAVWDLSLFAVDKGGDYLFTSQSDDRNSETPTTEAYDMPSSAIGLNLQWTRPITDRHELTMGGDFQVVEGASKERARWIGDAFTRDRNASGEQLDRSVYLQDVYSPAPDWRVFVAGRFDRWTNRTGNRSEADLLTGDILSDTTYPDRSESRLSYSLAVDHDLNARVSWRGSVYKSFRAPVLNELYRPSRASGNVLIAPEPFLEAETLIGGELGIDYSAGSVLIARLTGYWNRLDNPIIERTVGDAVSGGRSIPPCGFVPSGGTCRLRANLGAARTLGIESEIELQPHPYWTLGLSHVWGSTEVTSAPGREQLVGKTFVGLADHVVTAKVRHTSAHVGDVAVTARYVGERFDDDINTLVLDSFLVLDIRASRSVLRRWELFGAVENVFDREYTINRTAAGFYRIAAPRRLETGARWQAQ